MINCNRHIRKPKNMIGFTIIELSLSIAFISVLSIAIVLIITNAISSYHRGLTLNQVNTAGMDLVDDFRAAIQNSSAHSVTNECISVYNDKELQKACQDEGATGFVSPKYSAMVKVSGREIGETPVFGAFCSGNYSYIWNSGYLFDKAIYEVVNTSKAALKYRLASSDNTSATELMADNFKLLKVKDENRSVCIAATTGAQKDKAKSYNSNITIGNNDSTMNCYSDNCVIDITSYDVIDEQPMDIMVGTASNNLAIYDFTSARPAESSTIKSLFYSASFILGTVQGGINIKTSGNFCAPPKNDEFRSAIANFDYCAINKFNFAAQASGG